MTIPASPHRPVMLHEVLEWLRPSPGSTVVDCTVGAGGHSEALLEAVGRGGRVLGIDRDAESLSFARERLARFGDRFVPIHGDARDLGELLEERQIWAVDAIVADLGISSLQLDDSERGFAFSVDGPLDMRMNRESGTTAAELVATLSEPELRTILRRYGEERQATLIARAIVRERERAPLTTTRQLAELIKRVAGPRSRRFRIHPATRSFQALRIAVNDELEGLDRLVVSGVKLLRRKARLAVISFHSLEDRAVKQAMRSLAERCICPPKLPVCACGRENLVKILTSKPVRPTDDEVQENARARSSRLRVVERI
ncbi:MAG: 16S rRNA (cytosine(1402)-N(4))-methyltransferase RsmH [Acidobacteriota bacterium]|nr:16S rRNA (cytosine(1402)-N(4))-methyltransferase RsmH [Acidobacteriota bacterium]